MMMSADTGVLADARREAAALTAELETQENQLRRNIDLENRLQQQARGRQAVNGYSVDDLGLSRSVEISTAQAALSSSAQFQSRFGVSEELAFQRRFDESLDRSLRRKTTQSMATGGNSFRGYMGNVRDVGDLLRGEWSIRNVHGAAELGADTFRGTKFGNVLGNIVPVLGSAAILTAVLTPLLKEMWDTFSGSAASKALKDWSTAVSRTGKIAPGLSADARERALGAIRMGIAGEGDTFDARVKDGMKQAVEGFQRRMQLVGNPAVTAALLSALRFDKKIQGLSPYVSSTSGGVEDFFQTLEQNGMHVETLYKDLEKEVAKISEREQKQKTWFVSHPQEASQYHERLRNERRIERMRFEQQQRDWTEM